jgi:predicted nucleic acid-binding protein
MNTVVIDANVGLSYVIPLPYSSLATQLMQDWRRAQARIVVPTLWLFEVLSGLRKSIAMGMLSDIRASQAMKQLRAMTLEEMPITWETSELILDWAKRLDQVVAYDAVYLATAEQMSADLWTAEKRLFQAAQKVGATWVNWLGVGKGNFGL